MIAKQQSDIKTVQALAQTIIIIPCLNEEAHLPNLLQYFIINYINPIGLIIFADGGSTDKSIELITACAHQNPKIKLFNNEKRIQSAAVNAAIKEFGNGFKYLIRMDAHGSYPDDYCKILVEEAETIDCSSVTTSLRTVNQKQGFQKWVADAQNAPLGNGGSAHRLDKKSHYVDHGHHALIKIDAFKEVGCYDESFSHNEDAELDYRLGKKGHKIWLTSKTEMIYYPRDNWRALWKQYKNYGSGRAQNFIKHKSRPRIRQLIPIMVLPSVLSIIFYPISPIFTIPLIAWVAGLIILTIELIVKHRDVSKFPSIIPSAIMHLSWSIGFWKKFIKYLIKSKKRG